MSCQAYSLTEFLILLGVIRKGCLHLGGREGVSNSVNKSGQGEGGGIAVCGHPIQCGFWKREKGI